MLTFNLDTLIFSVMVNNYLRDLTNEELAEMFSMMNYQPKR